MRLRRAENTHPVIVSENEYRLAQELMERKSQKIAKRHDKPYPLRQKIYCGSCNSVFRRKEIGTTVYWVCLGHDRSSGCTIRQIPEETANSNTTANPFSRRCSRTSKKSATAGCFGAKTSSLSTRKYPTYSVRFNS